MSSLGIRCLVSFLMIGVMVCFGCAEPSDTAEEPGDGAITMVDARPDSMPVVVDAGGLDASQDVSLAEDGGVDVSMADALSVDESDMGGTQTRSYKRGIAAGFTSAADFEALSGGVTWWYNWSPSYNPIVADIYENFDVDWVPMTWNGNNPEEVRAFLERHPTVKYLLGFNEPNFQDQANMTPEYAASIWPQFEAIAEEFQLQLIGPAVNYCGGCVVVDGAPIDNDYIVWLDMFFDSFRQQFGREPRMDYTALHWYDFGIEEQVNRIVERYGKPVWVTEFALWRGEDWNTDEFELNWLLETVAFLEQNPMVYRYAWFTGRRPDFPRINLLGEEGELTPLGQAYVDAPFGMPPADSPE